MLSLALRGLAARKLRGALTAFAILLGVAMVAGTFMLKGSRRQGLRRHLRRGQRRHRRDRQAELTRSRRGFELPESGARAPGGPGRRGRGRRRRRAGGRRITTTPRSRSSTRTATGSAARAARRTSPTASCPSRSIPSPGPRAASRPPTTRSRSTRSPPRRRTTRSASTIRSPARGRARTTRSSGIGRFGTGVPLGGASFAVFTLAEAQRITGKEGEFDEIDVEAADGVSPRSSPTGSTRRPAGDRSRRRPAPRTPPQQSRRHQGRLRLLHDRAARLRRDLRLRRRLPDLQHVLDHGRPAHPRVRDAADARRLLAAGARERDARGARARPPRLARSGSRPASASSSSSPAPSRRSASSCRSRAIVDPAGGDHRPADRRHRSRRSARRSSRLCGRRA